MIKVFLCQVGLWPSIGKGSKDVHVTEGLAAHMYARRPLPCAYLAAQANVQGRESRSHECLPCLL